MPALHQAAIANWQFHGSIYTLSLYLCHPVHWLNVDTSCLIVSIPSGYQVETEEARLTFEVFLKATLSIVFVLESPSHASVTGSKRDYDGTTSMLRSTSTSHLSSSPRINPTPHNLLCSKHNFMIHS